MSSGAAATFGHDRKLEETPPATTVQHVPLVWIKTSDENDDLYNRFDVSDPQNEKLVEDVKENGVRTPLVLTLDYYIISGHRRYHSALAARQFVVPCLFEPVNRYDLTEEEFVVLLRRHNLQRVKTVAEQMREAIVDATPEEAYDALLDAREERERAGECAAFIEIEGVTNRSQISWVKEDMARAVLKIVEDHRDVWPLSVRQIFYALLNAPPLFNCGNNPRLHCRFENSTKHYSGLTDLCLRLRLANRLDWRAIEDDTRPFDLPLLDKTPSTFFDRELKWFFTNYRRDLLQSQPHHIEIVGEKNTVRNILKPVADEYTIPLTTSRGFSSATPRLNVATRYRKSGKSKLFVLALTDFDPCGEEIANSFAKSLRDDFGVRDVQLLKVALTAEQVERFNLPPGAMAKPGDKKSVKFAAKYGAHVWELEALPMRVLQSELRAAIDSVLDIKAFNQELEAEKADAVEIDRKRRTAMLTLGG